MRADAAEIEAMFRERMTELRRGFVVRARQDAVEIGRLADRLAAGPGLLAADRVDLVRRLHTLAGAAGLFGEHAIGDTAFRLEAALRDDAPPPPSLRDELVGLEQLLDAVAT
jgi:HPt (histidine-containing phosphotransfer) domain-containing protein